MTQFGFDFVPPSSQEEQRLRDSRGLPADAAGLEREAKEALRALNSAIVTRQPHRPLIRRYAAIVERLRRLKGVDFDAAAGELAEALRTPDGKTPGWVSAAASSWSPAAAEC